MAKNFVSYSDATTIMTEIGNKLRALNGAYVIRGNSAFANLPATLTKAMNGYVYNVTDEFTTTANFVEGAGKKYPAGTNVAIVNLGNDTTPDMKFDVIGSFIDVDAIEEKIQNVSDMIAGEFSDSKTYAIGNVVVYEGSLYRFDSAHAAGAWDSTETTKTTIDELISAAEPASLTTAQVEALVALLE